jgi:hypothetical protein
MKISQSRNVATFVRVAWRHADLLDRLRAAEAKLAPLRDRLNQAHAAKVVAFGALNGRQRAEAERLLALHPTQRSMQRARERAKAASGSTNGASHAR